MHVYNNLLHVCVLHADLPRAVEVFQRMLMERVKPDARTYKLLLQACTEAGQPQEAAGFLRAAFNLRDVHPLLASLPSSTFRVQGGLPQDVVRDALTHIAKRSGGEPWTRELFSDLMAKGCVLDGRLKAQLLRA